MTGGARQLQQLLAEPACRVCGCTNAQGCPGGCIWVEDDLCSRCAREQGPETLTELTAADLAALEQLEGEDADVCFEDEEAVL